MQSALSRTGGDLSRTAPQAGPAARSKPAAITTMRIAALPRAWILTQPCAPVLHIPRTACPRLALFTPVVSGGETKDAAKHARHMGLVGESAGGCDFDQRLIGVAHQGRG